jgi:TPR repeat protein
MKNENMKSENIGAIMFILLTLTILGFSFDRLSELDDRSVEQSNKTRGAEKIARYKLNKEANGPFSKNRGDEQDAVINEQDRKNLESKKADRKSAEEGVASEQFNLGHAYDINLDYNYDLDRPEDFEKAVEWYRKAAEQGFPAAQFRLGEMYVEGRGVHKDLVKGYAWNKVASFNGDKLASITINDIIAEGMSPKQVVEAQYLSEVWFEKFQPGK